jgi:undecaprenyl-diphosphatase
VNAVAGYIKRSDKALYFLLNKKMHCHVLNMLMRKITHLGSFPFGVTLPFLLYTLGNQKALAIRIAILLTFSQAAVQIIKRVVNRARPYMVMESRLMIPPPACRYSFPSGHTCAAFALALGLAGGYPALAPLFYLGASLVGFSRIYLGVHYPSDVLVGFFIASFTYMFLAVNQWFIF